MTPNFLYSALLVGIAIGFVVRLIASQMHKRDRATRVGLATQTSEAEHRYDETTEVNELACNYSADHGEWSDFGSSTETSVGLPNAESPSSMNRRLCPRCGSDQVEKRNQARKAGSTIGAVAGATSGVAVTLSGAEFGATAGLIAGPIGSVFGGLAGAILAGLAASAAGCAAGAAVGEVIDENVLDNHRCSRCGHTFNASV